MALRTILLFASVPVALALFFTASLLPLLAAYAAWLAVMFWGARRAARRRPIGSIRK